MSLESAAKELCNYFGQIKTVDGDQLGYCKDGYLCKANNVWTYGGNFDIGKMYGCIKRIEFDTEFEKKMQENSIEAKLD